MPTVVLFQTLTKFHELGHAFGLLYEHQRPDRNDFVEYNCQMLVGYSTTLRRAQQDGYTAEDLC
jgi:hypothetical protein